jgi:hypothetical protein
VIYSDDESLMELLKSMDRLAEEAELFRCFCGPPGSQSSQFLSKLKWYDGTTTPYCYARTNTITTESVNSQAKDKHYVILQSLQEQQKRSQIHSQKNIKKYCGRVIENLAKHANNRQVYCLDFLINDVASASLRQALTIEEAYNNNRIPGLTYCTYMTATLLNSGIKNILTYSNCMIRSFY